MPRSQLRFDGRVAIVTGAGGGLGRAYALLLGSRGCAVVVNDLGGSTAGEGASSKAADAVVAEIRAAGGKAVASYDSVEVWELRSGGCSSQCWTRCYFAGRPTHHRHGAQSIREARHLDLQCRDFAGAPRRSSAPGTGSHGARPLLPLLQDGAFQKMDEKSWDLVYRVHLRGSYSCARAAWNHMREAGYGQCHACGAWFWL